MSNKYFCQDLVTSHLGSQHLTQGYKPMYYSVSKQHSGSKNCMCIT